MTTANLADGTVLNFPDNTSQEVISRVVKQHILKKAVSNQGIPTDTGMPEMPYPVQRPSTSMEKIVGGLETGLSLATAIPSVVGGYAGLLDRSSKANAEERFAKGMQAMTYAPRTQAGQSMLQSTAEFLTPLQAIAPMTQMSALSRLKPVSAAPILPKSKIVSQAAGVTKQVAEKAIDVTKPAFKFLTEPLRAAKAGLYDPVVNQKDIVNSALRNAIGEQEIPNVIKSLERKAQTPNVRFSAAQASGNPALAAMEDTLSAINPSGELNLQAMRNRAELAKGVRSIAQDEFAIDAAKQARTKATEPLYKALDDVVISGGDELNTLLSRMSEAGALQEAKKISGISGKKFNIPVIDFPRYGEMSESELPAYTQTVAELPQKVGLQKEPLSLSGYLRKTGGISQDYILDVTGEKNPSKSGATVGLFNKKARSADDAVQRAIEGDYLPESVLNEVDGGVSALMDLLSTEIQAKQKVFPLSFDNYSQQMTREYNQTPQNVTKIIGEPATAAAPLPTENIIGQAFKGRDLINLKKGIDQAIKKAEPNSPLYVELLNLKSDYMNWFDNQGKGFLEANNKFAEMSKPINQMKVGKILSDKLIPATAEEFPSSINAAQLARALKNKDEIAKKVTGIKGLQLNKILTQKQFDTILGINSDASRIAEVQKLGAGFGSPTARRLNVTDFIGENFKRQAPVTSKIIEILNSTPIVGYATKGVSTAGSFIGKKINANIAAQLEGLLASDPLAIANALKQETSLINKKKIKLNFTNPMQLESGLLGNAPMATEPLQQFQQ